MKNKKRRLETFSLYDHTGIERHLERMAKKGWLLEEMTSFGWIYRAIEPRELKFTVTYYPAASAFDPEPSEKQRTYWDFCRQDGWKLAAASAQMQVFYSEEKEPYPIETDPLLQLQGIRKTMKKGYLPVYLILLLLGLMQGSLFWGNLWEEPVRILSSSTSLYNGVAFTLLILLSAAEIFGYFRWYRRAQTAAKLTGSFLETRGHSRLQKIILLLFAAAFLLWILSMAGKWEMWIALLAMGLMLSILLAVNGVKTLLKRKKAPAGVNRTLTILSSFVLSFALMTGTVFVILRAVGSGRIGEAPAATYEFRGQVYEVYHDHLPLTVEDLMETDYQGYSYEYTNRSSPLAAQMEARQRPRLGDTGQPDLTYTITTVKLPALYEFCRDGVLREFTGDRNASLLGYRVVEEDGSLWGADQVYQYYSDGQPMNRYLVCYDDHMVEIWFGWEPTQEQMERAGSILKQARGAF